MTVFEKIWLRLKIEFKFLLEQKWGIKRPTDPHAIRKSILKKYLSINPVIIDCGAHGGSDSVELARIFPNGKIHSIEAVPIIYNNLIRNTKKYLNISCYHLALSDENGTAKIFISSGSSDASSSLLQPTGHLIDHPDVYFSSTLNVKAKTLDTWATENGIERVDFLWLDMQGFELKMLQASKIILPTVKAIYTEVSTKDTYEGVVLYSDLRKWLENMGFCVICEAIPDGTDMGNVLFVKE